MNVAIFITAFVIGIWALASVSDWLVTSLNPFGGSSSAQRGSVIRKQNAPRILRQRAPVKMSGSQANRHNIELRELPFLC